MKKPSHTLAAKVLALSALLLLPACSPRKAIPSDPPEVRTEAQVRGAQRLKREEPAAQPVAEVQAKPVQAVATQPLAAAAPAQPSPELKPAVQTAEAKGVEVKAETNKVAEATPAAVKPVQAKVEAASAEAKAAEAKVTEAKVTEAKAADPKVETKAAEAKAEVKATEAKAAEVKADTVQAIAADAAHQAATQAPKALLVQIASFNTEKNAQGALSWLKEKGYSEARVVRVEQAQAVYHRVQAGPFQDLAAARKALEELKADWPQAFIPAD